MHKVSIKSDENGHTKILVDGVDVSARCCRIKLEQNGGEFPQVTLTFVCDEAKVEAKSTDVKK